MRKNFGPQTALYPMPVFIIGTYDENMVPDAMNAAWGGISEENEISICISAGHKTRYNFEKTGYFTVSIADAKNVVQADYVGKVIPDEFVGGYGLDYDEKYRNLPFVGILSPEVYSGK